MEGAVILVVILVGWALVSHFWLKKLGVTEEAAKAGGCACCGSSGCGSHSSGQCAGDCPSINMGDLRKK